MYHCWSLEAQFWSWFYLLVCKLTQESMHWFIEQLYSYSVIVYGSCCLCAVSSKTLKIISINCFFWAAFLCLEKSDIALFCSTLTVAYNVQCSAVQLGTERDTSILLV